MEREKMTPEEYEIETIETIRFICKDEKTAIETKIGQLLIVIYEEIRKMNKPLPERRSDDKIPSL